MLKNVKLIFFSVIILLVHFSVLIFLVTSNVRNLIYEDSFVYVLLLMLVGALAFYISYFSYSICKKSRNARMFILSLVFYIFGLTLLVQAFISGSDFNLFSEYKAVFKISQYYGFFAGSILLLGLAFPLARLKDKIYRYRSEIFLSTTLIYLIILFSLALFPGLAERLNELINFFIGVTGIFFFILIVFLVQQYREAESKFLLNFIIGLIILINGIIINFFDYDWNLLWWYTHVVILLGFLVIFLGLLRVREQETDLQVDFGPIYTKISTKLVASFLLVVILSIFTTGYISYSAAKDNLKTQALESLKLLSQTKKIYFSSFLNDLKNRSINIAADNFIIESISFETIVDEEDVNNDEDKDKPQNDLGQFIKQKQLEYSDVVYKISIANLDGIIIESTNDDEIGKNISKENHFTNTLNFNYGQSHLSEVFIDSQDRIYVITASSPIVDKNTNNKLGIVINYTKINTLNSIIINNQNEELIQSVGKIRNPEMYLVSRDNWLLTSTSFRRNAILKERILTKPITRCKYGDEINEIYQDYRNISVIGASACLNNGWVLVIEEDEFDVFAGLEIIKMKIALSSMIVMALVLILIFFLIKKIIDPIKNLSLTAKQISHGDLSVRAEVTSRGEIGILAQSFNQMTESLIDASKYVRNMIRIMPTALITMDGKGKINNVNEAALKMLGYKQKELLRRNVSKIFGSKTSTLEPFLEDIGLKNLIKEGHIDNQRIFLLSKEKEEIPVLLSSSVLTGSDNEMRAIIFIAKDLRELTEYARKRLNKITPILKKVSKGDFSQKISIVEERDEFSDHLLALNVMIGDFRSMMGEIKEKSQELEEQYEKLEQTSNELKGAKEGLENKVKERTRELQEKLLELERFNRIAVGRELKMVELKQEIKRLQSPKSKV